MEESASVMSSIDIRLFSSHYWSEIMKKLKRGILFLEVDIYRVLHFNGGAGRLFEEGKLLGLREFSSFNYGAKEEKKGIFIISSPLHGLTRDILKEIISSSSFEYVQVITTASPSLHSPEDGEGSHDEGMGALKDLEEEILDWMGDANYTVEIFHYPLLLAPLTKDIFLTPAFGSLSPLDFDYIQRKDQEEVAEERVLLWSKLPPETRLCIRRFASFWTAFLGMYGVKPDVFSLGGLSSLIGDHLNLLLSNKSSKNNPNHEENKVSLLFIDRTADLGCFLREDDKESSSALEFILRHLPPYPGCSKEDVSVDMSELFNSTEDFQVCPPGSLADGSSDELFDALLCPLKESLHGFEARLRKASKGLKSEGEVDKKGSSLANEFISVVQSLPTDVERGPLGDRIVCDIKGDNGEFDGLSSALARFKLRPDGIRNNIELLQKSLALRNAVRKADSTTKASLIKFQEGILKDLSSKYPENVFETLIQILKKESLSLREILKLCVFTYARLPLESVSKDPEARDELESLLSERILLEHPTWDELRAHKCVKNFFAKCQRANAGASQSLRKSGFSKPYLELLLREMYSDELDEIPELTYKSRGSLGGRLIKSGLSFLGLSVKDKRVHPRENPIIFIFVVGGISPGEIQKIRGVLRSKNAKAQFIIASNALLHSESLLDQFFTSSDEDVL